MMANVATPARRGGPSTIADWLAQPEGSRLELIDGDLVEKAAVASEEVESTPAAAPATEKESHHLSAAHASTGQHCR
jgi:hypothetical protein